MIKIRTVLSPLAVLALIACLFDKPTEEIHLTLSRVPAGTERIRIVAVEKSDTSKVLGELHSQKWSGSPIRFPLGLAQGKECFLRVEGYRGSFLVYLSLIPPGKNSSDPIFYPNVDGAWPSVVITKLDRDSTQINITSEFRNVPARTHWVLAPNSPCKRGAVRPGEKTLKSTGANFQLGVAGLIPGTCIIFTLHDDSTGEALPVQLPDTVLTDEALAPSGSSVSIVGTMRKGDSVEIFLELNNFTVPDVDEPVPGRGWPMVHDARGLRPLPGFHVMDGDITRITGPAWELDGVTTVVVALHYADSTRIRPLVAATVPVTTLLDTTALPTIRIISHKVVKAPDLQVVVLPSNLISGRHYHIFRDQLNSKEYQLCRLNVCSVDSAVWTGATRLIAAVVNKDHSLFVPEVKDTLTAPF